jgi:hypothetical protein
VLNFDNSNHHRIRDPNLFIRHVDGDDELVDVDDDDDKGNKKQSQQTQNNDDMASESNYNSGGNSSPKQLSQRQQCCILVVVVAVMIVVAAAVAGVCGTGRCSSPTPSPIAQPVLPRIVPQPVPQQIPQPIPQLVTQPIPQLGTQPVTQPVLSAMPITTTACADTILPCINSITLLCRTLTYPSSGSAAEERAIKWLVEDDLGTAVDDDRCGSTSFWAPYGTSNRHQQPALVRPTATMRGHGRPTLTSVNGSAWSVMRMAM